MPRIRDCPAAVAIAAGLLPGPATGQAESTPNTLADAIHIERANAISAPGLYTAPQVLSRTGPRALLEKQDPDGYPLPPGATATVILYHSLDADGRDVATSGLVLVSAGSQAAPAARCSSSAAIRASITTR